MKFESSFLNETSNQNTNSTTLNNIESFDEHHQHQQEHEEDIKFKNSSFSLKVLLEKTKYIRVLNCNTCRKMSHHHHHNHHRKHHHHHHHNHRTNIIKPIALRPNQSLHLLNSSANDLNDLNSRFSQIDLLNNETDTSTNRLQRRNTIPRVNFKNINYSTNQQQQQRAHPHEQQMYQLPQHRPHLNFIKMKLQRYLNENSLDYFRSSAANHADLVKFKTFDYLSLSALNLTSLTPNVLANCRSTDSLYQKSSSSSSLSSLSSIQNATFQMSLSASSNESDLDIAQIESDLNF